MRTVKELKLFIAQLPDNLTLDDSEEATNIYFFDPETNHGVAVFMVEESDEHHDEYWGKQGGLDGSHR